MAHSLSAKKRVRQNLKRRARNHWRKDQIKDVVKAFETVVHGGDKAAAADKLKACFSTLDAVAAKGVIHKNAANRKKSRLAKRLHKLGA